MRDPQRRRARRLAVTASTATALVLCLTQWGAAPTAPVTETSPAAAQAAAARPMENLGRGVVAVRSSSTEVLVTWRLLGLDPQGIGFNVYRSTDGGEYVRINDQVLTDRTNYVDSTADLTKANRYRVRPVIDGAERAASGSFVLSANHAQEPAVRVPLRDGGPVKFVWVGDLTGDGAMTFKGYMQSHHVDYYLGAGMSRPPRPDIRYVGR
ncbi:hypothetical protein [Streptomyces sp. NPDC059894]|uniref:rhamnogalacturonan endolyase family protein n=1 Tax=unclassified Streptomyces TaxID=2593676 RepID=UPI00365FE327